MDFLVTNKDDYFNIIGYPFNKFNSMYFNDLNKMNTEEVYYFLFKNNKYRLGLIAGVKNKTLSSPFSALLEDLVSLKVRLKLIS